MKGRLRATSRGEPSDLVLENYEFDPSDEEDDEEGEDLDEKVEQQGVQDAGGGEEDAEEDKDDHEEEQEDPLTVFFVFSPALPMGWDSAVDEASGKEYYYNTSEGVV